MDGDQRLAADLARLAALQAQLRAVEDPDTDLSEIDASVSPGLRRRLRARVLHAAILADIAAEADREQELIRRGAQRMAELAAALPEPEPEPPVAAPAAVASPPAPVRTPPRPRSRAAPATRSRSGRAKRVVQPALPLRGVDLPEFWSPVPVLGFRVWGVRGRLCGVQRAWESPVYTAGCLDFGEIDDEEVPHTDGRCRPPPCGLYAIKSADALVRQFGLPPPGRRWAYGLVALSGKVVEHEHGYRARRARAVAVVVMDRGQLIRFDRRDRIEDLFADPERLLDQIPTLEPGAIETNLDRDGLRRRLVAYLDGTRLVAEATGIEQEA